MNRTPLLILLFSTIASTGCERKPEATCESYIKLRKDEWPTSKEVQKECEKDLTALKERSPKAYTCAQECVAMTAEHIIDCFDIHCSALYTDEANADLWMLGLGSESSGSWADEKPKKLTTEQCQEGAYAISGTKAKLGVIEKKERSAHRADLFKACKEGKNDPTYAKTFACLRRVTKKDQILECSPPSVVSAPGGASAAKIEGCVSECTDKHGRDANAAYMSCFNQCKAR